VGYKLLISYSSPQEYMFEIFYNQRGHVGLLFYLFIT
jgi:hypothetical protein